MFRIIAAFASGNIAAMALGTLGSLVQARYVGPEDMGIFRTFGIAVGYLTFLHLGVFDGLQREIPLQLGRGERAKAEKAASACLAWILVISAVCATAFLVLALRAARNGEWKQAVGWLAYMPLIVSTFYGGYLGTTFRTGQQFVLLAKSAVIAAVAGSLVLPLMPLLGYFGACLRTVVSSITGLLVMHRMRPLKIRPRLDWHGFREVVRIGLPLSGAGYVATSLWVSMEGTFILAWYGANMLGLYAMAALVRSVVVQLAQNVNQVVNVRVCEQYGRSGRVEDCVRVVLKPAALSMLGSLPVVAIGWLALPWVVPLLTPKYVGAIHLMQLMLLAMPMAFLSLPVTILWATGRRVDCFAGASVGLVVFVGFATVLHKSGSGANSLIIASMVGQLASISVSFLLILRLALSPWGHAIQQEAR
jgi:O-antigen/teichoic acid export membrane protein